MGILCSSDLIRGLRDAKRAGLRWGNLFRHAAPSLCCFFSSRINEPVVLARDSHGTRSSNIETRRNSCSQWVVTPSISLPPIMDRDFVRISALFPPLYKVGTPPIFITKLRGTEINSRASGHWPRIYSLILDNPSYAKVILDR